ncbi:hypothetical protein [Phenylobacterium sp.]|uniref:hypothetical protein n=1 Tax=Phenylobacterium sp. TaxID=1871053 RepID=UPI0025D17F39|nr:hypothetical protein [Phenylobacterium sp.]
MTAFADEAKPVSAKAVAPANRIFRISNSRFVPRPAGICNFYNTLKNIVMGLDSPCGGNWRVSCNISTR